MTGLEAKEQDEGLTAQMNSQMGKAPIKGAVAGKATTRDGTTAAAGGVSGATEGGEKGGRRQSFLHRQSRRLSVVEKQAEMKSCLVTLDAAKKQVLIPYTHLLMHTSSHAHIFSCPHSHTHLLIHPLSYTHSHALTPMHTLPCMLQELQHVFNLFDTDGSGHLDTTEVARVLNLLGKLSLICSVS
jgi:hypothetical protein